MDCSALTTQQALVQVQECVDSTLAAYRQKLEKLNQDYQTCVASNGGTTTVTTTDSTTTSSTSTLSTSTSTSTPVSTTTSTTVTTTTPAPGKI